MIHPLGFIILEADEPQLSKNKMIMISPKWTKKNLDLGYYEFINTCWKPIFVDLVVELNYENRYDWSAISVIIHVYCNLLIKSLTTNSYVSLNGSYIHKIPKDWISRISQNPQRLNTANVNSHNRPLGINNK